MIFLPLLKALAGGQPVRVGGRKIEVGMNKRYRVEATDFKKTDRGLVGYLRIVDTRSYKDRMMEVLLMLKDRVLDGLSFGWWSRWQGEKLSAEYWKKR